MCAPYNCTHVLARLSLPLPQSRYAQVLVSSLPRPILLRLQFWQPALYHSSRRSHLHHLRLPGQPQHQPQFPLGWGGNAIHSSIPTDINASGYIVGYGPDGILDSVAFLRAPDGTIASMPTHGSLPVSHTTSQERERTKRLNEQGSVGRWLPQANRAQSTVRGLTAVCHGV